jgi:heterodisulfide reductase subunit A
VAPKFVERALARGAAAVLVSGCHIGDCHYINANIQTQKRVERLWKKMERLGLNKDRLQLAWISAAEGEKFASKIKEMQDVVSKVTKEEIEKSKTMVREKAG